MHHTDVRRVMLVTLSVRGPNTNEQAQSNEMYRINSPRGGLSQQSEQIPVWSGSGTP